MRRIFRFTAALLAMLVFIGLFVATPFTAGAASPYNPAGWQPEPEDPWFFYNPDGTRTTGWVSLYGNWYYIKQDGTMATGWLTHSGSRYYFNADCVMVTGWFPINDKWYYFNPDGAMVTGWIQDGNYWYYLNHDGTMDPNIKDSSDWMLTLVNAWNPVPEDYTPRVKSMSSGWQFDERAIPELNAMLAAARAEGLAPVITSAYRTVARQQQLHSEKIAQLVRAGLDPEQAVVEASRSVSYPGRSEHNMGLAVDIVSAGYRHLNENQETTPEMQWFAANCAEYGFILRYPRGKEDITGIIYEPWHFRYVGVAAARDIMARGICLEEYLGR